MGPSILGPRLFVMSWIQKPFLPVADGGDAISRDPQRNEIFLGAVGPPFSEGEVIFVGSPFVAVPLDLDFDPWAFFQHVAIFLQRLDIRGTDVVFVKIKKDILQ